MDAWIEDAQVLTEVKTLNKTQNSVLLKTEDVENFLFGENVTSCAIVAPKGFGKTFVLKIKRVMLQQRGYRCFPTNSILDRPRNRPPILPNEILDFLESSANWESLWQISFILTFLKSYGEEIPFRNDIEELKKQCGAGAYISNIIENLSVDSPFDILHSCLSAQRAEIYHIVKCTQHFTRLFQKYHRNSSIFVDNIDEYLQYYIIYDFNKSNSHYTKYLKIWHNGQIGAWLALRRLHGINPHVKVYISIRKEAYHYATQHEPDFANLRAFRRELKYTKKDIEHIIENNISIEKSSKLVDPGAEEKINKFLGQNNEYVANSGTGKQEDITSYWLRHCSLRPRDAVSIGNELSKISPSNRTQANIRSAINASAAERVENLFNEVSPFFDALFPQIFPIVIESNVLSFDDLVRISDHYAKLVASEFGVVSETACHPFCALYSIGLLGVVQQSRVAPGNLTQIFSQVGSVPFGSIKILPKAEIYVIHPSLSDYIAKKNVNYLANLNKHNVVGDGLEWRPQEEIRFVVIGDMKGYRNKIMNNVGSAQTFEKYWTTIFKQFTSNLDYAKISSGDSILLADRSPARLLRATRNLMKNLANSGYDLKLRIGGHSGFWRIDVDSEGIAHPEIADIVGIAARIEPQVKPGDILISEKFLQDAQRLNFEFENGMPRRVDASYAGPDNYDQALGIKVSKPQEADQWLKLYIVAE